MFDVIVIGGGPAGVTAALRARELGASVALIERERLGGTYTIDGCVPTRIFARAARLMRVAEQFEAYGLVGQQPSLGSRVRPDTALPNMAGTVPGASASCRMGNPCCLDLL